MWFLLKLKWQRSNKCLLDFGQKHDNPFIIDWKIKKILWLFDISVSIPNTKHRKMSTMGLIFIWFLFKQKSPEWQESKSIEREREIESKKKLTVLYFILFCLRALPRSLLISFTLFYCTFAFAFTFLLLPFITLLLSLLLSTNNILILSFSVSRDWQPWYLNLVKHTSMRTTSRDLT